MRYKATVVIAALILVILAGTYIIGYEPVEISPEDQENRRMTTFDMVWKPVTDENSEIYNANKSISDRFEDAMKDQISIRPQIISLYNELEARLGGAYNRLYLMLNPPKFTDSEGGEETEEPPVINVSGLPDEYYDLPEKQEPEIPAELDFETYPVYGYKRLSSFKPRQYSLVSVGQGLYRINDTDWLGPAPSTSGISYKEGSGLYQSVQELETLLEAYPYIKIYHYFVSQSAHTPWFDSYLGVKSVDPYEIITRYLPEEIKFDQFDYDDLAEYQFYNYKGDHHWNHNGSEYGYQEVYRMMAEDLDLTPFKLPTKEWNFSELYGVEYRGSRARSLNASIYNEYDEFLAYEYDLGRRETYVIDPKTMKETPVTLTLMERYKAGDIDQSRGYDHYINFYGQSYDKSGRMYSDSSYMYKIVHPENETGHNLLIVGDSTQRAYRDVLASHYDTTIYLDYRILQKTRQDPKAYKAYIDDIIEEYDIDVILIGGLPTSYWNSTGYKFTFSSDFNK